jgi:hypothetical protein
MALLESLYALIVRQTGRGFVAKTLSVGFAEHVNLVYMLSVEAAVEMR